MRVLPATLPRNRYNATKLDLRGMPNPVKTTLGGLEEALSIPLQQVASTNQRQNQYAPGRELAFVDVGAGLNNAN
jgi:hypothetical protein